MNFQTTPPTPAARGLRLCAANAFELHNLATGPKQAEHLAAMGAALTTWMKQQGDQETIFGKPLLLGEPSPLITPGNAAKRAEKAQLQR